MNFSWEEIACLDDLQLKIKEMFVYEIWRKFSLISIYVAIIKSDG